jgi:hypothetical protein
MKKHKFICIFQCNVLKTTDEIPIELRHVLDKETFEKSRLYQLDSKNFGFWNSMYSQIETTVSSRWILPASKQIITLTRGIAIATWTNSTKCFQGIHAPWTIRCPTCLGTGLFALLMALLLCFQKNILNLFLCLA